VGGIVGGLFGLLAVIFATAYCYKRYRGKPLRSNQVFINQESNRNRVYEKNHFETGEWSTRYYQAGRWHGPHSLSLTYDQVSGTVVGQGHDDVGAYTITGVFSIKNQCIGLTKKYHPGTGNRAENFAHSVTIQLTWNDVHQGFEGKWFIQTASYRGEDKFELKLVKSNNLFFTKLDV
jgi:hypothetical protein